jgi:riboflavin transporter FmnP
MRAKDLALIGIFSALSFGLMFLEVPLLPFVSFLKYDPSEVPALILALNTTTLHGILVIVFKDILFYFAKSGDIIGIGMNMLAGIVFVWIAKALWKRKLVAGIGSVSITSAVMTAVNAGAIPLYFTIMKWGSASDGLKFYAKIWWAILLFNVLKFSIDFIVSVPLNRRMEKIFRLG